MEINHSQDNIPEDLRPSDAQFETSEDHADVKILPPFIFGSFLILAVILEIFMGANLFRWSAQLVLGLTGLSFGAGLMTWCVMRFINAATALNPKKPTSTLVTDGPYCMSRNPIYVAFISLYLGIVFIFDIVWGLPLLLPMIYIVRRFVITPEEAYLERRFGEEYETYKKTVRRWL
ncbi:MAG: isoprenylcysteine carboxylmethyltransferase family protein [Alphaproteobacteria bacterium]|nr:isoprenylcysteine carboxylmethyltransferase family protein [Alphaproteobacteria bacterium]